jgi:hypothetical protein
VKYLAFLALLSNLGMMAFAFGRRPVEPATAVIVDLDEPTKPQANQFCDEDAIGNFEPIPCPPRYKDLRHTPELFTKFL